MSNLPLSGQSNSLDNVGVTREQFRGEIGQVLQYLAQALGGIPGTYTTQAVDPLAVLLAGAPALAPGATPAAADDSARLASTAWTRDLLAAALLGYLPLAGGTLTGNVANTATGFLGLPVGTTAERPAGAPGMLRFNTTTGAPEIYQAGGWTALGGGGGGGAAAATNLLINAGFRINQREYVLGTATTAANQYTLDRWRVDTAGQALTLSNTGNSISATAPAGGMSQIVEGINIITGNHVLTWQGTATAQVNGTNVTTGTPFALVGGAPATIRFLNGTVLQPKLGQGDTASGYAVTDYGAELLRCQRYFEWVAADGGGSAWTPGDVVNTPVQFKATKRVIPTLGAVVVDPTRTQTASNVTSVSVSNASTMGCTLYIAAGNQYGFGLVGYRASVDAEL